jgi:hypothetical protein
VPINEAIPLIDGQGDDDQDDMAKLDDEAR